MIRPNSSSSSNVQQAAHAFRVYVDQHIPGFDGDDVEARVRSALEQGASALVNHDGDSVDLTAIVFRSPVDGDVMYTCSVHAQRVDPDTVTVRVENHACSTGDVEILVEDII